MQTNENLDNGVFLFSFLLLCDLILSLTPTYGAVLQLPRSIKTTHSLQTIIGDNPLSHAKEIQACRD